MASPTEPPDIEVGMVDHNAYVLIPKHEHAWEALCDVHPPARHYSVQVQIDDRIIAEVVRDLELQGLVVA